MQKYLGYSKLLKTVRNFWVTW